MTVRDPEFLELEDVLELHADSIERYGGDSGVRDQRLIESAVAVPRQSFGGEYLVVDVAARVAHRVLKLPSGDEFQAAWKPKSKSKSKWIGKVRRVAPTLAAVVDSGSHGGAALTILSSMRNSVHGTALQGLIVSHHDRKESLVSLPERDRDKVSSAMDALGGQQLWGARRVYGDGFQLDPGIFVDRLVDMIAILLNELMKKTPVEQLPNVALTEGDCLPPTQADARGTSETFAAWVRRSVRWQLGLGVGAPW